jgi:hypothetical protein
MVYPESGDLATGGFERLSGLLLLEASIEE